MYESKISLLEERHMLSTLLYVREHPGCSKSDLYRAVSKNPRMPDKLEILQSLGLLRLYNRDGSSSTFMELTDKGSEFAEAIASADRLL